MRARLVTDLFLFGLALLVCSTGVSARDTNIAAASSLNYVLPEIAATYRNNTSQSVKLIFGSSRSLVHQIIAGAPFDVFLSADIESVRILRAKSLTDGPDIRYGRGRLALFAAASSRVKLSSNLKFPVDRSDLETIHRFAIANPKIAPYGQIARDALQAAGVWERLADKLVVGQNALQTAQFAASGSVDAALIPYSLAIDPRFMDRGRSMLVSEELYHPLDQGMVLIRGAGEEARAFFSFLQSDYAKSRFKESGL